MRASDSRAIIFGVVPDATREWNPEIAPHAIVMNANGNSLPANTGPSPSVANGVSAGIRSGGGITKIATARTRIVGVFRKVERESRGHRSIHTGSTETMEPYPIITPLNPVAPGLK